MECLRDSTGEKKQQNIIMNMGLGDWGCESGAFLGLVDGKMNRFNDLTNRN